MATIRFRNEHGPVALAPSAITAVAQEADGVWIQDIHGEWWHALDSTFNGITSEIDFAIRNAR